MPSGTAAGSDCVLQSGGSYLSLSTHTAAPLPVEIGFSLLLTQKRGERGVCTHANIKHTHTNAHTNTMTI